MLLKNFWVLMFVFCSSVTLLTDSLLLDDDDDDFIDPKRDQILKTIPKIIKRSYVKWNRKPNCNNRVLRSTNAKIRPLESEWFSFNSRMPRLTTPLLKSQVLFEFYDVGNISQVYDYNYTIVVQPLYRRMATRHIKHTKIFTENDSAEIFFNITSIHYKLKKRVHTYLRFQYRLFITGVNETTMITKMPFEHKRMNAYLITLEENKNCTLDFMTMNTQKLLQLSRRRSMLRTMQTLPVYPSNDNPYYTCRLRNWYVPFAQIGWSSFVIAPATINAGACSGTCDFPLIRNATHHALLQAAVSNTLGRKTSVCCVPLTTEQATLVIYDEDLESVLIIKSDNIVATSCGCR